MHARRHHSLPRRDLGDTDGAVGAAASLHYLQHILKAALRNHAVIQIRGGGGTGGSGCHAQTLHERRLRRSLLLSARKARLALHNLSCELVVVLAAGAPACRLFLLRLIGVLDHLGARFDLSLGQRSDGVIRRRVAHRSSLDANGGPRVGPFLAQLCHRHAGRLRRRLAAAAQVVTRQERLRFLARLVQHGVRFGDARGDVDTHEGAAQHAQRRMPRQHAAGAHARRCQLPAQARDLGVHLRRALARRT